MSTKRRRIPGIVCKKCGTPTYVSDVWHPCVGLTKRRRRCKSPTCGYRFTTEERASKQDTH